MPTIKDKTYWEQVVQAQVKFNKIKKLSSFSKSLLEKIRIEVCNEYNVDENDLTL